MSTPFDSLTKKQDKLIHMEYIRISKGKDDAIIFKLIKNENSKEKQIVKEKKPKSDNEDERSNLTDEGSMKKVNKKWVTYKCSY